MIIDKFEEQRNLDRQTLFREREVQNLRDLIYGKLNNDEDDFRTEDESLIVDSNRYDVHHSKLEHYTNADVKKMLKSKFVTGQSQDQIMKNLLNMSDSDDEVEDDRKIKKLKKKVAEHSDESEGEEDEDEPAVPVIGNQVRGGKKQQIAMEEIRKDKEKERLRREEEEKKKLEKEKSVSLFLGESHGHYKMGVFVRIELQI